MPKSYAISHITANGHIVSLQCASFHVGILNSAGELFLGGDNDSGNLGTGNSVKYHGMKKLVSPHFFTCFSVFSDSTVAATKDGQLLLLGNAAGSSRDKFVHTLIPFPRVCQLSGLRLRLMISTEDGQVFRYSTETGVKELVCDVDTGYRGLVSCRSSSTLVCLAEKEDSILNNFHLLFKSIYRRELQDVTIITQ